MTETLPDVIHLKPDVHKPMSRLYDRPRLQHTHVPHVSPVHVPPVSPVLNTYSDIEASLRRRTNMLPGLTLTTLPRGQTYVDDVQQGKMQSTYSDVTTSRINPTHSTSDAHARTTPFSSDVHQSLQPRMTPSNVAVPSCNQVHRRKSEVSLNNPKAHPLFRRF